MTLALVACIWIVTLMATYLVGRQWLMRRRTLERMYEDGEAETPAASPGADDQLSALARWLFRAGYRSPNAPAIFLVLTAVALLCGASVTLVLLNSELLANGHRAVSKIPGGLGDILAPLLYVLPWAPIVLLGSLPSLRVRAARRRRIAQVDQDLPLVLELLATLSEAGLGFDAALDRVLAAQSPDRPLTQEFRLFQMEVLAGRPRVQCLRRLGWRLNVTSLTIFTSALVQSEQVGAGVADVLRRQADDLCHRRRELALGQAMTLPTKLLFPLVICFLPGILVATLGPAFYQIFQLLDGYFRVR